ncbi:hypothetical protein PIB30_052867 [Stylosanthes scabra]|uniref:CCHC-type domain-containing protein n=1 Tax=Stylosanthes scabra TaxID=79078 RepID=A0ABU6WKB1_9FABA|nr:hypothetical protein [Stylosanthes scabra]
MGSSTAQADKICKCRRFGHVTRDCNRGDDVLSVRVHSHTENNAAEEPPLSSADPAKESREEGEIHATDEEGWVKVNNRGKAKVDQPRKQNGLPLKKPIHGPHKPQSGGPGPSKRVNRPKVAKPSPSAASANPVTLTKSSSVAQPSSTPSTSVSHKMRRPPSLQNSPVDSRAATKVPNSQKACDGAVPAGQKLDDRGPAI